MTVGAGSDGVRCPVCGDETRDVLRMPGVPTLVNSFSADAGEARGAPRGDIDLVVCGCGLLFNGAFDESIAEYDSAYENSLHFSPRFQAHAQDLAERLASRNAAPGATVLEIGSGGGDFLSMVAALGFARGVGLDPSLTEPREATAGTASVTFLPGRIDALPSEVAADLVVCRHVLEHVTDPVGLLRAARDHVAAPGAALYVEVPDGEHMLRAPAVWDLIYEHFGYFTAPALEVALARAGWDLVEIGTSFEGQFLWAEAVAGSPPERPGRGARSPEGEAVTALADRFGDLHASTMRRWTDLLADRSESGREVAVWGAGSKGVTFVNTVGQGIGTVVDVNPRKQGRFVPGTGHRIEPPEALRGVADTILVMNPIYLDEVGEMAHDLGLTADLLPVEG